MVCSKTTLGYFALLVDNSFVFVILRSATSHQTLQFLPSYYISFSCYFIQFNLKV